MGAWQFANSFDATKLHILGREMGRALKVGRAAKRNFRNFGISDDFSRTA
jgi:hypothetical protein